MKVMFHNRGLVCTRCLVYKYALYNASKNVSNFCVCHNRNMASMFFWGGHDSLIESFGDVDAHIKYIIKTICIIT